MAGFVAALLILLLTPRFGAEPAAADNDESASRTLLRGGRYAFPTLLSIGVIDSATRMGFLTFLPFILTAKGASLPTIGLALTLVFAGGAVGKLVCAYHRRAHRSDRHRVPDRDHDAGSDLRDPAAAARRCAGDAAGPRHRAERHVVGALWLGAGSRAAPSGARAPSAFSIPAPSAPARSRRSSTVSSATPSA